MHRKPGACMPRFPCLLVLVELILFGSILHGSLLERMRMTRNLPVLRFLSACVTGLLMLTLIVQARLGQVQGADEASFESHRICESHHVSVSGQVASAPTLSSISETPIINSALTGVMRSAGTPTTQTVLTMASIAIPFRPSAQIPAWHVHAASPPSTLNHFPSSTVLRL